MPIEFKEWPKTPRLLRNITITEKIDGTNAAIGIMPMDRETAEEDPSIFAYVRGPEDWVGVYAQSRTRLITPGKSTDNYGFAGWVERNAARQAKKFVDDDDFFRPGSNLRRPRR